MKVKEIHFVYFLIFLHAIATLFTGFFKFSIFNPGPIRGVIVFSFVVYFIFNRFNFKDHFNFFIVLFLLYFGFLSFLSDSLYLYTGFFISLMMFPIGFYYFNSVDKLYRLSYIFCIILLTFIIYIFVSNIFKLGSSDYLEDSFYFGEGRVNITKTMIILLFSAPIYLYLETNKSRKRIALFIYLIGFFVCLIGIKRTVLVNLFLGPIIYFLLGPSSNKFFKYLIVFIVLSIPFFYYFSDVFIQRFEAREQVTSLSESRFEEEARYSEFFMVMDSFINGGLIHKFFGSYLFNDTEFFNTSRMLHIDYMVILNGAGIIGILFWFFHLFLLLGIKNSFSRLSLKSDFYKILNSVFWMCLTAQVLISISGTIYSIDFRSFVLLLFGAILRNLKEMCLPVSYNKS
ncbi:MAG: O-antigen polymerase [Algoriphagus aquaeductus]|uniref:O-antigen polymerase n=1 Tax=Algoriphagus aquaeductus TaxID=475299 RepID=UPI00391D5D1B